MRVLDRDEVTLPYSTDLTPGVVVVDVPMVGAMLMVLDENHPNADRCLVARQDAAASAQRVMAGQSVNEFWVPARRVDGRIEVDVLHKADRLCVVVEL